VSRADASNEDSRLQRERRTGRDYSFKNLVSWQKAQGLLLEILQVAKSLPNDRIASILVQQIVRSSSAIGANIAEGHGRYSAGAYRNHLSIARGSTTETISWLDVLRRAGYISEELEARLSSI
jgi:four helix bundle protein